MGQPRIDNPDTRATLNTGQREQNNKKYTTQHRTLKRWPSRIPQKPKIKPGGSIYKQNILVWVAMESVAELCPENHCHRMRCENINVIPQNEQSPPILTHLAHGNVARLNLLMGFQASPLDNDKKDIQIRFHYHHQNEWQHQQGQPNSLGQWMLVDKIITF